MFPLSWPEDGLLSRDFVLFELQFGHTVSAFLPAETVQFVPVCQFGQSHERDPYSCGEDETPSAWQSGISLMDKRQQAVLSSDGTILFLPIWCDQKITAAAVITAAEGRSYEEYALEWLHERGQLISREFRKIKLGAFDPESGLLNGQNLREDLLLLLDILKESAGGEGRDEQGYWALFMLEIFPKAKNSGQASAGIARAAISLRSFFGEMVAIHHLGSGLFAMIWHSEDSSEFRKLAYTLLAMLKRRSFSKVHIGIAPLLGRGEPEELKVVDAILDQAWRALKDAETRGPFALCSGMGGDTAHLLRPPAPSVLGSLARLWRGAASFSVVLLEMDGIDERADFSRRLCTLAGEGAAIIPENGREAYLFLAELTDDAALAWLTSFKKRAAALGDGTFSMGVASYPCVGIRKKSDIAVNARKALVHTAFLGPDTVTMFDGVSLNISGDVYYNGGDLTGAVRE